MDVQTIDLSPEAQVERFRQVRAFSERLCETLQTEDYVVQTMPDVSPAKWHLAHTTWFFETFVLRRVAGRQAHHPAYGYLFNSYYNGVGEQFPRSRRGDLTRPTVAEIYDYRRAVDAAVTDYVGGLDELGDHLALVMTIGLHHEQQHQELLLTDLKHVFAQNPLRPAYRSDATRRAGEAAPMSWIGFEEELREIGHEGDGFAYDNESPRHRRLVHAFELATRPVTNAEYLEFIEDGGYDEPRLWLSEGWATIEELGWQAPLYWERGDDGWRRFTLSGMEALDLHAPVTHLSLFEADAYAHWAGARLPTEFEWEVAAGTVSADAAAPGNFVESEAFEPMVAPAGAGKSGGLVQLFGDVWEWTRSAYEPYPGYEPADGALGEYNGKFMCNQHVLKGGSCVTSSSHIRPTYRNFFPAATRWQYTGLRLAKDGR